jgi:transposase InsO family protein
MAWMEQNPMDLKIKMIAEYLDGGNVSELARKFNVSRKTIYKWTGRYDEKGITGLENLSTRPQNSPNQTDADIVNLILAEKKKRKYWGPKKIISRLEKDYPDKCFPAPSTAGELLKKNGLVKPRRLRRRVSDYTAPLYEPQEPNDVWSIDYKGDFKTGDNKKCYPLTIVDNASRKLLSCQGLPGPRYKETREVLELIFMKHGLPLVIRSDNGSPFASPSIGGLSRLSVWWLKLGIIPERITKGCPQENGCHERVHRTLKEETLKPVERNLEYQQFRFMKFMEEYNSERPHESLSMNTPDEIYHHSEREYFEVPKNFEYDSNYIVRSVKNNGEISFNGKLYFLTNLLNHERIGFLERDEEGPYVYAGFYPVCKLVLRHGKMRELTRTERLKLLPMSPV